MSEKQIADEQIRYLGDVQRLELGPTDMLVLSVDDVLKDEQREHLLGQCKQIFGNRKVIILERGMKLGVVAGA